MSSQWHTRRDRGTAAIERPRADGIHRNTPEFGSDAIAETLRALDVPYIAINPGASFRGLHDSLVNYLGNENPQLLLCLHEEAAVAIAHGYAKVTGRAMAAAVHSNVGLFHATMAIFNAWCDRMPVLVIGATSVFAELQDDLSAVFARLDKAVIVVTHDLAEAAFFARRLVLLRQGRIVQEGSIETLLRAPAEPFVTHFVEAQRRLTVGRNGGSS